MFSLPSTTDSTQYFGLGDTTNGYFVGYQGTSFGILRRYGGVRCIWTLTLTAAATSGGTITVTIDGTDYSGITVSASAHIGTTAQEIAAASITGWHLSANGTTVIFGSHASHNRTGTFAIGNVGGTGVAGAFVQVVVGVAPTDDFVPQTAWNIGRLDGVRSAFNPTGVLANWQYGNVIQIQMQWLGFGAVTVSVEQANTGVMQPVHRFQYANSATTTSITRPSNHLSGQVIMHDNNMCTFILKNMLLG